MQKQAIMGDAGSVDVARDKVKLSSVGMAVLQFVGALLLSKLQLFGVFLPFGLALSCSLKFDLNGFAGFAGIITGLVLIGNDATSLRYISAVIVAAGVRGLFGGNGEYKSFRFFTPALCTTVCFATGMADILSRYATSADYLILGLECVCAFLLTMMLSKAFEKDPKSMSRWTTIATAGYAALLLLAGYGISFYSISPGRIAALILIFVCARALGAVGGGMSGCVCGLLLAAVSPEYAGTAMCYGLCGFGAGMLARRNKLALTMFGVAVYCAGSPLYVGAVHPELFAEGFIAAALFLLLPQRTERLLKGEIISLFGTDSRKTEGDIAYIRERIRKVSGVISEFMRGGAELGTASDPSGQSNLSEIFNTAADKVCRKCGMSAFCWNEDYGGTMAAFNEMTDSIRENDKLTEHDFVQPLRSRCIKKPLLTQEVNSLHTHYKLLSQNVTRESARGGEIWAVYRNFAYMMSEIAQDAYPVTPIYEGVSDGIRGYFEKEGIHTNWIHSLVTADGNLTVEMLLTDKPSSKRPDTPFFDYLRELTGKNDFNLFVENTTGGYYCLVTEKENYEVNVKSSLMAKHGERESGDKVGAFKTKDGKFYVILSDGMGSGEAACKESGFVTGFFSQLIRNGVSIETTLRMINNALAAGGPQDYFATADIFVCDLYNGKAEFIKAGAAPSLVARGGKFHQVKSRTLPLGILGTSDIERTSFRMKEGDCVLMLSDGVADDETELVRLESVYLDAKELENCVSRVLNTMQLGHQREDDMTVVEITVKRKSEE